MAEYSFSSITTLVTPSGTITFNAATGDTLWVDPSQCRGLVGPAEVRSPMDDKGQTDGSILHIFYRKGQAGVLGGWFLARTDVTGVTGRDALMTDTETKLESLMSASTGTLNFAGGGSITVKCRAANFFTVNGNVKGYLIDLVSADP